MQKIFVFKILQLLVVVLLLIVFQNIEMGRNMPLYLLVAYVVSTFGKIFNNPIDAIK